MKSNMKIRPSFGIVAIAMLGSMSCDGCANNQSSAASTNGNPAARSYTGADLTRTGKRDAGDALRAADPSVTTTTGR